MWQVFCIRINPGGGFSFLMAPDISFFQCMPIISPSIHYKFLPRMQHTSTSFLLIRYLKLLVSYQLF